MAMRMTGSGGGKRGTDKRRIERRVAAERRCEVRWEPAEKIRRDRKDRRATGVVWNKTRER